MGPLDPRVHIDHVVLRVAGIARSVDFYGDLLGLEVVRENNDTATLAAPDGEHPLIVLRASAVDAPAPVRATGLFHTALRWPTRSGLGEVLERLVLRGQTLIGAADHGVSEALYLDDPDGNGVELYWDRPRSAWPTPGPGERMGMVTRPLDLDRLRRAGDGTDARGCEIGHVHLQVAEIGHALGFWADVLGFSVTQRLGADAAFLAAGDYHHHVGVNTWRSRGAQPGAHERPGLDAIAIGYPDADSLRDGISRLEGAVRVPGGVRIVPVLA